MSIVFYMFASFSILGALGTVLTATPIYSVLSLIFLFLNAAGLFILVNAEFLAMTLIILYVGALAVVFLFIIMLIDVEESKKRKSFNKFTLLAALVIFIFSLEVIFLIIKSKDFIRSSGLSNIHNLNSLLDLGIVLYNQYFYLVLVLGLMLLITLIGVVIVVNKPERSDTNKQSMSKQRDVVPFSSTRLIKSNNKEGLK